MVVAVGKIRCCVIAMLKPCHCTAAAARVFKRQQAWGPQVRFSEAARRARARQAAFGGAAAGELLAGCRVHIAEPAKRTAASVANLSALKRIVAAHGGKVGACLPWHCGTACI